MKRPVGDRQQNPVQPQTLRNKKSPVGESSVRKPAGLQNGGQLGHRAGSMTHGAAISGAAAPWRWARGAEIARDQPQIPVRLADVQGLCGDLKSQYAALADLARMADP